MVNQNSIMSQFKKLQAIVDIWIPKIEKQLSHFIRMNIFYQYIWKLCANLLAQISTFSVKTDK